MTNKINNKSGGNKSSGVTTIGGNILSASVLAYCGYKIINNRLIKSKYEPNPNKKSK